MGGLAILYGTEQVAMSTLNPFVTNSGGVSWLNNATGDAIRRYQLYADDPSFFGKAHGLGDLELMCSLQPIEIGNYVWNDTDGDGIQDPNESGIGNVVVNLYDNLGNLIATTTTNSAGEYIFNDDNVIGGLLPQQNYTIAIGEGQYTPSLSLIHI